MAQKRLFVDMDGTLARFHDEVDYLERMFEEDFFANLKPFENMVAGINRFIDQHPDIEVYTITACVDSPFCVPEKNQWLDAQGLNIPRDHRIFTEMGKPKAEYIPAGVTKDDYLLDDYNKGLNQFLFDGGSSIKCHNNINQQGLGAHGGSPGNLWVGPMVHTDDMPEMIAAELAQQMELEFDLEQVATAYGVNLGAQNMVAESDNAPILHGKVQTYTACEPGEYPFGRKFTNPLNAVRFLSGNEDFLEHRAKAFGGEEISTPAFRLRDIFANLYNNPDFKAYLRADRSQFVEDVSKALEDAQKPMVGQIQHLYSGGVGEVITYHDMDAMKKEIADCQDCGRPIDVKWFIPPRVTPLNELQDFFELDERLYYEHGFDEEQAGEVASILLIPYKDRTEDQMETLTEAWHSHELPGTLREFLRMTKDEYQQFLVAGADQKEAAGQGSPSFEDRLTDAISRANAQFTSAEPKQPEI